jgi:prepilin-type processing-associated H-X9-DG protein
MKAASKINVTRRVGANFLFTDGSVPFLSYSAANLMPALATRAGGEVVSLPE